MYNIEERSNYNRQYYQGNKEAISIKQKSVIMCECGAEVKRGNARHKHTNKHNLMMTIKKLSV